MKKERETCDSFAVAPQTAKIMEQCVRVLSYDGKDITFVSGRHEQKACSD